MSADYQPRAATSSIPLVLPQPVTDRSIMESVTEFISDVVPQVSAVGHTADSRDTITWAKFEDTDSGDDLLLVLGYGSGIQVWSVNNNGEAREALSWRRGVVRSMRILLTPDAEVRDAFAHKRPMVALCDSAGPGQQFCSLSFLSLQTGDQVKIIKYKNPVNDVVCSRRVVVVSFAEKLAVLDAGTLEERKAIITCFPVSGPNPNPIALGPRWLAYADKRISTSHLSAGGAVTVSGQTVTATVLQAAKSIGKVVANSLTGQRASNPSPDVHSGFVSILDVNRMRSPDEPVEEVVAHFVAHTEAIVAMSFDPSGMLLLTADKSGHDFHVFRIHPHACGSSLAAIHHLYVLHRGDTAAKVQDIAWTVDSRWVAVSTLRGTTHVFPVTSYGGPVGVRTHLFPHVVNKLSRFHRSAGLMADGRNSPETVSQVPSPSPNPRLPPFPNPCTLRALGQIRQSQQPIHEAPRPATRQSSIDEPTLVPVRLSARFASPRGWLATTKTQQKPEKRLVDSLFMMSCNGNLIEYHLSPHSVSGTPKEKVCDDTSLELDVEAKAEWKLHRTPHTSELTLPLSPTNPLMLPLAASGAPFLEEDEHWLSQVEIVTHAGPHRRLWMGPQFSFKTFSTKDHEPVDVGVGPRSNPINIPLGSSSQPVVPVLIESASYSSLEQSPRLQAGSEDSDSSVGASESQLAESLAEAMMENITAVPPPETVDFVSL